MTLKVIIFLGLIAIAIGSAIVDNKKTTEGLKQKQPLLLQGLIDGWYTLKPFPKRPHNYIPNRTERSPEGGSVGVNIDYNDKSGTTGSLSANQNIWSSSDGQTSIDVNAVGSTNFDSGDSAANIGVSLNHDW